MHLAPRTEMTSSMPPVSRLSPHEPATTLAVSADALLLSQSASPSPITTTTIIPSPSLVTPSSSVAKTASASPTISSSSSSTSPSSSSSSGVPVGARPAGARHRRSQSDRHGGVPPSSSTAGSETADPTAVAVVPKSESHSIGLSFGGIGSFFRSMIRGSSGSSTTSSSSPPSPSPPSPSPAASDAQSLQPRAARFAFTKETTSHKSPEVLLGEIERVLRERSIPFRHTAPFCVQCQADGVNLEFEICSVPHLSGMYLIHTKRIASPSLAEHKRVCNELLAAMHL